ncbi:Disulfide bond formation protein DsbA [Flavobacterium sp. 9AF]|uniref:DsbA family oxidoreductase n=1 Tax=Flavobacterium sp. 9AF TaxID=2653142 RepID=UPI0012F3539A|nr:DsbA family oxidoreductase [Flavobacterium sp. 9AF]VXC24620.1 Disulfide bond formation protein DsbA [Flavobacterium sp. 9AF]
MNDKMKIQIWSDIMCPFCYIGKRRIEAALNNFAHKDNVIIEWKSFQLDPNFKASENDNVVKHLANKYGKDIHWATQMTENVTQTARSAGLNFHFDKAIMANSFHAHRLLHLAKKYNLGNELKEQLFKAYFTEGKDVHNLNTLSELGQKVGMQRNEVESVLHSNAYADEVENDITMAKEIGIQGVPFFVFDNKYAVSGAQPEETFLGALEKTWQEGNFEKAFIVDANNKGLNCGIDGCE